MMDDFDVEMDEEEEGAVFTRTAAQSQCWEHSGDNCMDQQRGEGGMVNSRSWAEELQDIFVQQAEEFFVGSQTRRPSISVSDGIVMAQVLIRATASKNVRVAKR